MKYQIPEYIIVFSYPEKQEDFELGALKNREKVLSFDSKYTNKLTSKSVRVPEKNAILKDIEEEALKQAKAFAKKLRKDPLFPKSTQIILERKISTVL
ncbi:hypothetical protein A9Q91_01395 [Candidatus Gracilibacteria bacterium 28_42_T64]|nr:hypothetical protein A9Q91_01395 [Candidatus Gracilibacteria bacterium 28_42_T64]